MATYLATGTSHTGRSTTIEIEASGPLAACTIAETDPRISSSARFYVRRADHVNPAADRLLDSIGAAL